MRVVPAARARARRLERMMILVRRIGRFLSMRPVVVSVERMERYRRSEEEAGRVSAEIRIHRHGYQSLSVLHVPVWDSVAARANLDREIAREAELRAAIRSAVASEPGVVPPDVERLFQDGFVDEILAYGRLAPRRD